MYANGRYIFVILSYCEVDRSDERSHFGVYSDTEAFLEPKILSRPCSFYVPLFSQAAEHDASFILRPLHGELGVEVVGVDLKGGISPELHAQLQEVMHTKDLLLFRGQVAISAEMRTLHYKVLCVSIYHGLQSILDCLFYVFVDRSGTPCWQQDLEPKDEDAFMRGFPHNEEAVASDNLSNHYFKDWRVPDHKLVAVSHCTSQ